MAAQGIDRIGRRVRPAGRVDRQEPVGEVVAVGGLGRGRDRRARQVAVGVVAERRDRRADRLLGLDIGPVVLVGRGRGAFGDRRPVRGGVVGVRAGDPVERRGRQAAEPVIAEALAVGAGIGGGARERPGIAGDVALAIVGLAQGELGGPGAELGKGRGRDRVPRSPGIHQSQDNRRLRRSPRRAHDADGFTAFGPAAPKARAMPNFATPRPFERGYRMILGRRSRTRPRARLVKGAWPRCARLQRSYRTCRPSRMCSDRRVLAEHYPAGAPAQAPERRSARRSRRSATTPTAT